MRIRTLTALTAALMLAGATTAPAAPQGALSSNADVLALSAPIAATLTAIQDPQPPKEQGGEVQIEITDRDTVWYMDPVWITIGVLALILAIVLVAMATRGGGGTTTVVK